jgi:5-carboxymethyl-2-hydroxymuconic-semialdehyde dehydrogenase
MKKSLTNQVMVGSVPVGGGSPIVVQSMTNTDTADVQKTTEQIFELWKAGSEIVSSEIFGPVLTMQTFSTDDQVVEMANNTEFGLAAVIVSGNREHAKRIASEVVAGTIWVNCFFVRDLKAPFGGSKKSGIGREGGTWSFDFYADVKNTVISPNGWKE